MAYVIQTAVAWAEVIITSGYAYSACPAWPSIVGAMGGHTFSGFVRARVNAQNGNAVAAAKAGMGAPAF